MLTKKRRLKTGLTYWDAITPVGLKTARTPSKRFYDVVIIGCGVTGALAAEALSESGLDLLVVDRRPPGHGSTSASTALIQWEIDQPLSKLIQKVGAAKATACYLASRQAVSNLKRRISMLRLDCDMVPRGTLLIAGDQMGAKALQHETQLRRKIRLPSQFLTADKVRKRYGFEREGAILSAGSIELDPRRLALGMAKVAQLRGVEIAAPANVEGFFTAPNGVLLTLDTGMVIGARKLIVATGYETMPEIPKHKYDLISTWALATVKQPKAAFWGGRELVWEASDPYLYFRSTADNRIIVGGEDASYFNPDRRDSQTAKKVTRILKKLSGLLPEARLQADYSWAGTFAESPTGLPVIGPIKGLDNTFGILGAGGNGITFSVIAAQLAKAWVRGKPHPLASLFTP